MVKVNKLDESQFRVDLDTKQLITLGTLAGWSDESLTTMLELVIERGLVEYDTDLVVERE